MQLPLRKNSGLFTLILMTGLAISWAAEAQNKTGEALYNEHSVRPIRKDDQMFKKSLWFRVDLRTKMNVGMFAEGHEITQLLIDAVRKGMVKPYVDDKLHEVLDLEEFNKRLRIPQADFEADLFANQGGLDNDDWGDDTGGAVQNMPTFEDGQYDYFPRQLFVLELKMDRIFDQRRSRMYNDLLAVTLIIPAEMNPLGIDKVLASFSYKDLYDNLFHIVDGGQRIDNPEAIWFNMQNPGKNINLADAFDMRLYDGLLIKYENPHNKTIVDMYGQGKRALQKSQEAVYQLMEYEALLWSY